MNKYRRVQKEKDKAPSTENEIRVTAQGRTQTYISYAAKIFNEKNMDSVKVVATGTALATAVTIAEVLKRRFKGLHQITHLGSIEITDEYEPLEEGLDKVTDVRNVSLIEIILSKAALDAKDKGYQQPLPEDEVKELTQEELTQRRGGRRKGGGRGRSRSKGEKGGKKGGKGAKKGGKGGKDRSQSRGSRGTSQQGKAKKGSSAAPKGKAKGKGKASNQRGDSQSRSQSKGAAILSKGKSKGAKGSKGAAKGSKSKGRNAYDAYDSYDAYDTKGSYGKGSKSKGFPSMGSKGFSKGKGSEFKGSKGMYKGASKGKDSYGYGNNASGWF